MRFLGTVIDEAPRVRLTKERIRSKKTTHDGPSVEVYEDGRYGHRTRQVL